MSAPLDNIRKLGIHCSSLKDDLVPAMVSLVRGMTNLNSLYIKTSLDGGDAKSVVNVSQCCLLISLSHTFSYSNF